MEYIAIFFVLGLIIGSFLNVLVYRLRVAETILGRSYCPNCKHTIAWYDNIPVLSFILLRFQCRNCRRKISWQYPLVEIFTGLSFAFVGAQFFEVGNMLSWITTAYYFLIISAFIVILVYDFLYLEIPSIVLWISAVLALAFNVFYDVSQNGNFAALERWTISGLLAAGAAFLFFFTLSAFSKEKWMGMGDAYLVILLGLVLGWPAIILGIFLAFSLGAIYGIILMSLKKKTMKSQVPFAPFLVVGSMIALFYYKPIVDWYFGLFL